MYVPFRTRRKPYFLILVGALHKLIIQAHFMFPEPAHFPLYVFPIYMVIFKNSLSPNVTGINCKNPMAWWRKAFNKKSNF